MRVYRWFHNLQTFTSVRATALAAVFIVTALTITWPLALHLGTQIPLGSEHSSTVPFFNLWTLWWNVDRLTHLYRGVWNAPIFAPAAGTFAFSEPQFLTGLLAAPIWLLTNNGVLAYNFIILLFLTLNGLCAYILMSGLSANTLSALLTGLLVEVLPFVTRESGVLQLVPLFGIILTLHYLHRFASSGHTRDALGLGGAFALTFYFTGQYALLLSLLLLILSPILMTRRLLRWSALTALLLGALLAGALVAPVIIRQTVVLASYDMQRSLATIAGNSAHLEHYLRLPESTIGYILWNHPLSTSTQRLYPGTGLIVLGIGGFFANLRQAARRRWVWMCMAGVILAFALSFGPNLNTADIGLPAWQPYIVLHDYYPGLREFRSPFRFGLFVQIFLALLAGFGLDALIRDTLSIKRSLPAVLLAVFTLVELFPSSTALTEVPNGSIQDWVRWLATQPAGTAIAHVPFPTSGRTAALEQTTEWMLYQMWHSKPMVNGYSGFFPTTYDHLETIMQLFPERRSLTLLREYGVTHVLVKRSWLEAHSQVDWPTCLTQEIETDSVVIFTFDEAVSCR